MQAWDEEQMISWNLLENILSLGLRLVDFIGPTTNRCKPVRGCALVCIAAVQYNTDCDISYVIA